MLKISIVTPVYNRVQYIESTIQSILSQGYPNLEYIIIDGGSSDGTLDVIKKYESKLAYWISEPDKGMYDAIQKGFDKATGDIFAWLNSDDMYYTNSLSVVSEIFSSLDYVEWITGIHSMFNKKGECVKVGPNLKWSKKRFSAGDFRWIQQESTFWRRSLWVKAGGYIDRNFRFASDFELWCRFFNLTTLYSVNTLLAGFRLHGNQLSLQNAFDYEKEVKIIFNRYYSFNKIGIKRLNFRLFQLSQTNIFSHFYLGFLKRFIEFVLNKSYKLPRIIYYDFQLDRWTL